MVGPYSSHYTSYDDDYHYSSPSVDCTLSLGTPSTRQASNSDDQDRRGSGAGGYSGWDLHHHSQQHSSKAAAGAQHKSRSHRGGSSGGGDTLLGRRCANCDTTATPLWRNGPRGPKSLCNACGIRYKKEERRATAAAAATAAIGGVSEEMEDSHKAYYDGTTSSWSHQYFSPTATMGDVDGRGSDPGLQFATWNYNATGQAYQHC